MHTGKYMAKLHPRLLTTQLICGENHDSETFPHLGVSIVDISAGVYQRGCGLDVAGIAEAAAADRDAFMHLQ